MDLGLRDKVAVISGGSIGIGLAVAKGFAAEGAHVVISARNADRLETARQEIAATSKARIIAVASDIATVDGVARVVDAAESEFGGADILVNNAGSGSNETIMDAPDDKWQAYWELHVMAAVRLARGLVPSMRRRGGGVILNNASICATQPLWYEPIYNVTKAALVMLSKTMATEFIKDGIRVNAINPGFVLTPDWIKTAKQLTADSGGDWQGYIDKLSDGKRAHRSLRVARGGRGLLRLPLFGPRQLFRRLDLFRRRRHAQDGIGLAEAQPGNGRTRTRVRWLVMKTSRRYPSSTDVARLAGVSQSAVSRAFGEGKSISEETRRKVFEAAKKLDYSPNFIPRILLNHRSHLVAVVISGTSNPFYAKTLEAFTKALQDDGYQVLLVHVEGDHSLDGAVPKLASYRVDAIVSALPVLSNAAASAFARFKIPTISFNTPIKNRWVTSVCSDSCRRRWRGSGSLRHARRTVFRLHHRLRG